MNCGSLILQSLGGETNGQVGASVRMRGDLARGVRAFPAIGREYPTGTCDVYGIHPVNRGTLPVLKCSISQDTQCSYRILVSRVALERLKQLLIPGGLVAAIASTDEYDLNHVMLLGKLAPQSH